MTKLAPERMQGQIMGLFFASIAVGNLVAAFLVAMSPLIPLMTYPTYLPPWRYFLVVSAVMLLILSHPIEKMLKNSETLKQAE